MYMIEGNFKGLLFPIVSGGGQVQADISGMPCIQLGEGIVRLAVRVHGHGQAEACSGGISLGNQALRAHGVVGVQEHAAPTAGTDHLAGAAGIGHHALIDVSPVIPGAYLQRAGSVRPVADAQHLVGVADEALPGIAHAVLRPVHGVHAAHQVEGLLIVLRALAVGRPSGGKGRQRVHTDVHFAQGFIMAHGIGRANHVALDEILRLPQFALKHAAADFRQGILQAGIVAIHGLSVPQAVLIELDSVHPGVTVDHGAQTAVAQGQRVAPGVGGPQVTHTIRLIHAACRADPSGTSPRFDLMGLFIRQGLFAGWGCYCLAVLR